MATSVSLPVSRAASGNPLRYLPSLPDLFFALLLLALFGQPYAWQALLADGDTGWHIRTGEYVLQHGAAPVIDLYSFSRPGEPWYAWEWLSDVVLAQLHHWWGLPGVAVWAALMVALASTLVFAWLLWRGAGAGIALATALAATSAASVHDLARPHLFSLVLLLIGLWLLDRDRRSPTPWLWSLVPITALWANLHGGFVGWLGILCLLVAVTAAQGHRLQAIRYALLTGLSSLATLANPYGWQLHRHILEYLNSDWIASHVQEFQSPSIRSENMMVFALLLTVGLIAAARGWQGSGYFESVLVVVWGLAALRSARYVPWFAVMAAPVIASQGSKWWRKRAERAGPHAATRILWEASQGLAEQKQFTLWMPVLAALAVGIVLPTAALTDFPPQRFPVEALDRNIAVLSAPSLRLLTSDQWADYLIYRLHPRVRVFFDGRSDFYGPRVGDDYRILLGAGPDSSAILDRWGFTAALLPADWPLRQILQLDPHWRVEYRDARALLLVRKTGEQP